MYVYIYIYTHITHIYIYIAQHGEDVTPSCAQSSY